ncbi:DUF2189 domain-containing protein [Accumulibacter sp.]|uniref:DUF2189 domain-containing protein n=1 Tax=Accumulibacter sp. TaxID=2053492 RepID=UPI0025E438F4|nr:DUF2189 domain-containing protein [Accumulibacter sp.]MCM8610819.1 DUF2189 domain-containing protein [Accumulibacter sp.]MCM8636361.1 DUF2189 domain-containing protein [Accumulibacter sp.]MCM8640068.1 DUF2189 domain-containing protein [Accumulibacter sp.]
MRVETSPTTEHHDPVPAVRSVGIGRPWAWLAAGWRDLLANPIASLAYGLLFAIAGDLITIFAWRNGQIFIVATSGFFLVAPLLAGGLYEISRRLESGQKSTFIGSLAGGRRNAIELAKLGLLLGFFGLAWERISSFLFAFLAPGIAPDLLALLAEIHLSVEHRDLLLIWILAGGIQALLVFSLTVVSVPMLLDRPVTVGTAIRTSLRAVDANLLPMLVWGATVVVLTALGFLTLFFGLVVLMPLLGHATWHAYRDLLE